MGYRGCESGKCSSNQCRGIYVICMYHVMSISIINHKTGRGGGGGGVIHEWRCIGRLLQPVVSFSPLSRMNEVCYTCLHVLSFVIVCHLIDNCSITNLALISTTTTTYPWRLEEWNLKGHFFDGKGWVYWVIFHVPNLFVCCLWEMTWKMNEEIHCDHFHLLTLQYKQQHYYNCKNLYSLTMFSYEKYEMDKYICNDDDVVGWTEGFRRHDDR